MKVKKNNNLAIMGGSLGNENGANPPITPIRINPSSAHRGRNSICSQNIRISFLRSQQISHDFVRFSLPDVAR